MQNYSRFIIYIIVLAMSTVSSADVIIDNQTIPGSDIQSISVSPTTGNIFISTVSGYTIQKDGGGGANAVAITSFSTPTPSVVKGTKITVSWSIVNAASCTPAGGAGGWLDKPITLPNSQTFVTMNAVGAITFTINCTGIEGDTTSRHMVVNVASENPVSISSLTATPSTVTTGQTTSIAWQTVNASSCVASGGTGGWSGSTISTPSGSMNVTVNGEGSYNFSLSCLDADGGSASKVVTVTANPVASSCPTETPLSGNTSLWEDFWLTGFPFPTYSNRFMTIPRTGYKALEFNTANFIDNGKVSTIETTQTIGVRTASISECPGDFDVASSCKFSWGISGGLRWATDGRAGACQLDSNKTYYLNITYTNGFDPATTTCNVSPCITDVQHSNN